MLPLLMPLRFMACTKYPDVPSKRAAFPLQLQQKEGLEFMSATGLLLVRVLQGS